MSLAASSMLWKGSASPRGHGVETGNHALDLPGEPNTDLEHHVVGQHVA